MNNHDQKNLAFILSLKTDKDWQDWMNKLDDDDLFYALQLVQTAIAENRTEMMKLQEEIQAEEGLDCSEALEIINRVKKGASQ